MSKEIASLDKILLELNQTMIKIRNLDDFYATVMENLRPFIGFDDAVLVQLTESGTKQKHILTMSTEDRKSHPLYDEVVNTVLNIENSPLEDILNGETIDYYTLDKWLKKYPDYPGLILMRDTKLYHTISLHLEDNSVVFALLLFHFKEQPAKPKGDGIYSGIRNQLSLALQNIRANEEVLEEKRSKEILLSISEAATGIYDREDLYKVIMGKIAPIVKFDDAVLISFNEDLSHHNHLLTVSPKNRVEHKFYYDLVGQIVKTSGTPIEKFIKDKRLVFVDTKSVLSEYPKHKGFLLMKDTGLNHSVALQLLNSGQIFAILLFHFRQQKVRDATTDILFIEIANQIGLALKNVLANEEIKNLNKQLQQEKIYLQEEIRHTYNFENIIGSSIPMQQVFEMVSQVAPSNSTVIVLGETGTGKELIARAIHNRSPRNQQPLIKVNCAALPAQLLESELFGHEKGAFTGATERRIGKFELAHKGTIFLDEIGEIPLELQSKLLRVLQEREIERLGGNKVIKIDTRIITATNRKLETEVQEGNFRADLFFRLNVFPILLPPLRNRKEDIPILASHFLQRYAKKIGKSFKGLSKITLKQMETYEWPGNVRELEHLIERAVITAKGDILKMDLGFFRPPSMEKTTKTPESFKGKTLKDNERELILKTLKHCGGKVRGKDGAAALLDINPSTLESRMRKLNIKKAFV